MSMFSTANTVQRSTLALQNHRTASVQHSMGGRPRAGIVCVQASASLAAVGSSRSWASVAQDVKSRLASSMESNQSRMEQLMLW